MANPDIQDLADLKEALSKNTSLTYVRLDNTYHGTRGRLGTYDLAVNRFNAWVTNVVLSRNTAIVRARKCCSNSFVMTNLSIWPHALIQMSSTSPNNSTGSYVFYRGLLDCWIDSVGHGKKRMVGLTPSWL